MIERSNQSRDRFITKNEDCEKKLIAQQLSALAISYANNEVGLQQYLDGCKDGAAYLPKFFDDCDEVTFKNSNVTKDEFLGFIIVQKFHQYPGNNRHGLSSLDKRRAMDAAFAIRGSERVMNLN